MRFPKQSRIVDPEMIELVQSLPCIACKADPPSDAHHLTSRGAGGHDIWNNLMSLCRQHHNEYHARGPGYMIRNYPSLRYWLEAAERHDLLEHAKKPARMSRV